MHLDWFASRIGSDFLTLTPIDTPTARKIALVDIAHDPPQHIS